MGKKRNRKTYVSKGQRPNCRPIKIHDEFDKALNKVSAWRSGKNPWVTVENRGGERSKPFIKVRADSLWGNPKELGIYRA